MQTAGTAVNDDLRLEREADCMGARAAAEGDSASVSSQADAAPTRSSVSHVAQERSGTIVQRKIGDGNLLLHGHLVVERRSNIKYEIIGHHTFLGHLEYKLESRDGDAHFVRADDNQYDLFTGDERALGFHGTERDRTPLEVEVRRRYKGARTQTTFANTSVALRVLTQECGVPLEKAKTLISKSDWSYPMVREVVSMLAADGTLQPGLKEGVALWEEQQPSEIYTIQTTGEGSQLAQLIGCHLMEYQETNNGTQGPKQRAYVSRQKQLALTQAILRLPEDQVARHAIGLGAPEYAKQFPAPFDVKFEDGPLDEHGASTMIFKLYQAAISKRAECFDHRDTLDDAARRDRRESLKQEFKAASFNIDLQDPVCAEDYISQQFGLRDTESDNSMDESDDWATSRIIADAGALTLEQAHEFIFKRNVHLGVLSKEYAAKQAELAIHENNTPSNSSRNRLEASKGRRGRVQRRLEQSAKYMTDLLHSLGINVKTIKQRWDQLRNKRKSLTKKTSPLAHKFKDELAEYAAKSLRTLRDEGYPPPLRHIGEKTLNALE